MSVLITVAGAVMIWLDPDVMVPFQMWVLTLVWASNVVGWFALYVLHRVRSREQQATSSSDEQPAS
ncbi:hypothetical protein [Nocardiopsis sp. MG754419]|uniref:hypothetical protein n=1 Tax=Nocardiopsis sp. MG754419 TaxID=2259865 RepID=UPI0027DBCB2D|nr:hypothetical protein [Nocardiopsis sp. MG754419]